MADCYRESALQLSVGMEARELISQEISRGIAVTNPDHQSMKSSGML
jgi:hypothetical protein